MRPVLLDVRCADFHHETRRDLIYARMELRTHLQREIAGIIRMRAAASDDC
jgi:hypothetical protein